METKYQLAKQALKAVAIQSKKDFPTDKPAIRQEINDMTHWIISDMDLTEYQANLLHNYACKLHPKN